MLFGCLHSTELTDRSHEIGLERCHSTDLSQAGAKCTGWNLQPTIFCNIVPRVGQYRRNKKKKKKKKKTKKAKRRKYNFKFIHDLLVPSLRMQGNLNSAAGWPGGVMLQATELQTAWVTLTPPVLAASSPHTAATQPGIWLISATGWDITGLLGHTGGHA